jgi:hypothetical protein
MWDRYDASPGNCEGSGASIPALITVVVATACRTALPVSRADWRRSGFALRPWHWQIAVAMEVVRGAQGKAEQEEQDHP